MNKILLTCLLVGVWEFAGAVHAPQFGGGVTETLKLSICPHPGGTETVSGVPTRPSVGVRVDREILLGERLIQNTPEFQCYYLDGQKAEGSWRCPGLHGYGHEGTWGHGP